MDLLKNVWILPRLIAEELTGTIDEKNRVVLARWLDEDERHREEYADIFRIVKDWERGLEGSGAGEAVNGIPMGSGEISRGSEDRSVDYVE